MPHFGPPSYQAASENEPRVQLPSGELLSLAWAGRDIFSSNEPCLKYYELSATPHETTCPVKTVKRVRYRLSRFDGVGRCRIRLDDTYVLRDVSSRILKPQKIIIVGKRNDKRYYENVKLSPGITGWASCTAIGHFKAQTSLSNCRRIEVKWKDLNGDVVAIEEGYIWAAKTGLLGTPHLRLRKVLNDKDLDLLVTCWAARLWMKAQQVIARSASSSQIVQ